ncbi:Uncharacterised protein [Mycobacterium tuberculosis]|nr:Uncharacterised protein [Mycobacterium tuberculosis]
MARWCSFKLLAESDGDEESCAVTCRVHRSEGVPAAGLEARLIARLSATTWIRRGRSAKMGCSNRTSDNAE